VFHFLRDSGLFEEIVVPTFTRAIVDYVSPILDESFRKPLREYLADAVDIQKQEQQLAAPLITDYARKELTKALNKVIFESKLNEICDRGLRILIEEHDMQSVDLCAKFARATDTIVTFTREFSFEFAAIVDSCFKKPNPIVEVMRLHRALTDFCSNSFSAQHSRVLRTAFEKGFNTSPHLAARLLAEQIHSEFITKSQVDRQTFEQLISVFRMLNAKDVFEAYHHHLLSRRVLMLKNHIVKSDDIFLTELRKQCGPEYVRRCQKILDDLNASLDIVQKFKAASKCPDDFHALVFSRDAWPLVEPSKAVPPPTIDNALRAFGDFYRTQAATRRLQWSLEFSRVKLSVKHCHALKEVKCNGVVAIVLVSFNGTAVQTAADIAHRIKVGVSHVKDVLKLLQSKKSGRLVVGMHSKYRINGDVAAKGGIVSIPFVFPTLPMKEDTGKMSIEQNRGYQIDAAAMIVMKRERSMEKAELKKQVKEMLEFRLEDELFEKRLAHLAQILYVKLDPSGRVHYLP
jgi:hypothetical protein